LLQFQSTLIEEDDVKKLLQSIDKACEEHALGERRVGEIFEVWLPHLKTRLDKLRDEHPKAAAPNRPSEDVLAEILELARGQQKLLSSPEKLLPPPYLNWALRQARDSLEHAPEFEHPVFADLARCWERLEDALAAFPGDGPDLVP
jgi:hypothetical protein